MSNWTRVDVRVLTEEGVRRWGVDRLFTLEHTLWATENALREGCLTEIRARDVDGDLLYSTANLTQQRKP